MKASPLADKTRHSVLEQAQILKVGGHSRTKHKPELALALPLTSLIDAFSIIVIYLLIGTQSGGEEIDVSKHIELPTAEAQQPIEKVSPIVRIEKGEYYINDQKVAVQNLGAKLVEVKKGLDEKDIEILIQADTKMDYAQLDPLIRAGSEAGIQKLKFAVLPTK